MNAFAAPVLSERPLSERPLGDRQHFAPLDAVRVLAATFVVHHHFFGTAWAKMQVTGLTTVEDFQAFALQYELPFKLVYFSGRWVIQAFLFLSAFTLTLSALRRERIAWGGWYRSRLVRVYPSIFVSGAFLLAFLLARSLFVPGDFADLLAMPWSDVLWNFAGLTFLADVRSLAAPWWFNGLILSFYAVFPLLLWLLRRLGPTAFFTVCLVAQAALVTNPPAAFLVEELRSYPSDFIGCRLLELAFGMCLAERVARVGPEALREWLTPAATVLLVAASVAALAVPGLQKLAITVEPARAFLVFIALYALTSRLPDRVLRACTRLAGPSMIVYLIHMPLVDPVCELFAGHFELELLFFFPFVVLCFLVALPLDRLAVRLGDLLARPGART